MEVSADINLESAEDREALAGKWVRERLGPNATPEKVEALRLKVQPVLDEFCRRVVETWEATERLGPGGSIEA